MYATLSLDDSTLCSFSREDLFFMSYDFSLYVVGFIYAPNFLSVDKNNYKFNSNNTSKII